MASIGGPEPSLTRLALRSCFFSSFSRRFAARASSFKRFWNLVFDLLANESPSPASRRSQETRHGNHAFLRALPHYYKP